MDIAAVTMVHKEKSFLKLWVRHYEKIVGRENMYVVIHGEQPELLPIIQGCHHVFIPRRKVDGSFDAMKTSFLNTYANILFWNGYDCVIGGDVDELVFADPELYPGGLVDLLRSSASLGAALTCLGLNICETPDESNLDLSQRVFAQRSAAFLNSNYCKPLVLLKRPAKWTSGFHETKYEPVLIDGLYMAHLKYVCEAITLNEVSPIRKATSDQNKSLNESKYKHVRQYWSNTDDVFKKMQGQLSNSSIEDFDKAIPEIRETLRANRVVNAANRGGISFRLQVGKAHYLSLPKRFAHIL